MKQKVLFIGDLDRTLPEYKAFLDKYECIDYRITSLDQLLEDFNGKFSDIVAIYGAWLGFVPIGGFKGKLLENAPKSLKVISICSVGYDNYDGPGLRSKNVVLTNVPSDGAAGPVADLVLYNTLESFRYFRGFEKSFRGCNNTIAARKNLDKDAAVFDSKHGKINAPVNDERYGFGEKYASRQVLNPGKHTATIVGFGNIGKTIGQRLAALGMKIQYVKRSALSKEEESKLGYPVEYRETIDNATDTDLVVIACPATKETFHLINKKVIDNIKNPFRIINIGRGSVIDEEALVEGLKSGKVLFAGLDVFEKEPICHKELIGREDVILTPHIGASTAENFDHTAVVAMQNIDDVLQGGKGLDVVN